MNSEGAEAQRIDGQGGPDLLALHRRHPARYPFLLESVAHGTAQARWDILFAFPGASLELDPNGLRFDGESSPQADFLDALDEWWSREHTEAPDPSPLPFVGGWFLLLGYELAGQIEPTLRLPAGNLPSAVATRVPAAILRDHQHGQTWLVAEPGRADLLDALRADLNLPVDQPSPCGAMLSGPLTEDAPAPYLDAVRRIHLYILDGDVFQVNLSRRWRGELRPQVDDASLYYRLRQTNPAPFAGLATYADFAVLSSSPERLVSRRGDWLETRPIAGTRPRSLGDEADRALRAELIAHPKERAEHIMLIDLERNDLGRVCRPGSVEVNELMLLESYAHVHHIVSNVRGGLREGTTPGQLIRAVFPGGTITGCPKVRCMEIIAELEGVARGPYTGAMGYLNRNGDLDLNILIRSLVRHGREISLRAGAGIVADSDPERELQETRAKARGMLLALD